MKTPSKTDLMCKILHIGKTTFYKFKKENYSIFKFLDQFSSSELAELAEFGEIKKFRNLEKIEELVLIQSGQIYLNSFLSSKGGAGKYMSPYFIDFWFSFLIKNKDFQSDIYSIINFYFVDYINDFFDEKEKIKEISRYFYIFSGWNDFILIYLKSDISTYFSSLFESVQSENQTKREEVYFHIIALYVYTNCYDLKSLTKIEIINNLHDSLRNEIYTHSILLKILKKKLPKVRATILELHGNASLYS